MSISGSAAVGKATRVGETFAMAECVGMNWVGVLAVIVMFTVDYFSILFYYSV